MKLPHASDFDEDGYEEEAPVKRLKPSPHQQAVLDFVRNGRGHTVVEAVAGSGKSTLLRMVAETLKSRGVAVCFNKPAAEHLDAKIRHTAIKACTVHSLGFASVRNSFWEVVVDEFKYETKLKDILRLMEIEPRSIPSRPFLRLFELLRVNQLPFDAESWISMACEHRIETELDAEFGANLCQQLADYGRVNTSKVDFTDMIWLPVELRLPMEKYAWLLVDEAQDISRLQYALIKKSMMKGGRALFVGDRRQAIYHFAGADAASFQTIIDDLGATLLPLSVCYRCPTTVISRAKDFCPQIEAAANAEEGYVSVIDDVRIPDVIREGDLILSRVTAPIVQLCYKLIAQKISATIRGRDIGQGLITIVRKICKIQMDMPVKELAEKLDVYFSKERNKASFISKDGAREATLQVLGDKEDCLEAVLRASEAETAGEVIESIDSIFSDERASVCLSTIHRAKGLENDRVFLMPWPEWIPQTTGQEPNLRYVACTRAMKALYYVVDTTEKKPQK